MRLAVLGAGEMGATHAQAYQSLKGEGVELAGVFSRTKRRGSALARRLKTSAFDTTEQVFRDDTLDAVDLATPTASHRRLAVAALEAGKHVFCETPLALTTRDAEEMIRAARAHRRLLLVANVMRFVVPNVVVHDAVKQRQLGPARTIIARRLSRPYWSSRRPRPFKDYGDPLVELMIHDVDTANWMLGRPRRVHALGAKEGGGGIVHAILSVEYAGATAFVEGSADMTPGWPFSTELHVACEEGGYDVVGRFFGGPIPQANFTAYDRSGGPKPVRFRGQDPYVAECRHFVRAVHKRSEPTLIDARNDPEALRVIEGARQSWSRRRPVSLSRS